MAQVARRVGSLLATASALGARVRGKPLHPHGSVVPMTVRRTGGGGWGSPWLDEPGEDRGLARLSRSAGLPAPLPDVLGLALVWGDADGAHSLLLSTTGLGAASRFVLLPRTDPVGSAYGSLVAYRAPSGLVLVAAVPAPRGEGGPAFRLLAAAPRGPWQPFGLLRLHGEPEDAPDAPVDVDPVGHTPPGLAFPPAVAAVRGPSYAAARRTRRLRARPATERLTG